MTTPDPQLPTAVLGARFSEAVRWAAMLHADDVRKGTRIAAEIRARFGQPLADIVVACSEPSGIDRTAATWGERKQRYLDHLERAASDSALRVTAADKLHNARSILSDLRDHGPAVWEKFNAPAADQRWYYTELARVVGAARDGPTVRELQRVVDDLAAAIDASSDAA